MKEGVIVDISKNKLTVLTPEGDFLEIKNNDEFNQIGDLIYFEPKVLNNMTSTRSSRKKRITKTIIALAASILLIFSVLPVILDDSKVYAYVSLNVDSSIELSVSDDMEVVDIQGIDEEGKEILAYLDGWQDQDVALVVAQILLLLEKGGKITEGNEVVFSTVVLDKDKDLEESLEKKLTNVQDAAVESLKIETQKATVDDREKAKEKGVSTAAYLAEKPKDDKANQENKKENTSKIEDKPTPKNQTEAANEASHEQEPSAVKIEQKPADDVYASSLAREEKHKKRKPAASPTSQSQNNGKQEATKPYISEQRSQKHHVTEKKEKERLPKPNSQWKSDKGESNKKKSIERNDENLKKQGGPKEKKDDKKQNNQRKKNDQQKGHSNNREKHDKGHRGKHEDKFRGHHEDKLNR